VSSLFVHSPGDTTEFR